MANSTDAAFEAWLLTLTKKGYDRHWINRNIPALRERFDKNGGADMEEAPEPPQPRMRDRYQEI